MAPPDEDVSAGSILRELIVNQYQAIVLGGTAMVSLVALNPLPLLFWLGCELVLLPVLDSGPLRRLVAKRRLEIARAQIRGGARRADRGPLAGKRQKRYASMEEFCRNIETNYQGLTGISQAYLSEQRGKLDAILQGYLNRWLARAALRTDAAGRNRRRGRKEIEELERELAGPNLPERAVDGAQQNLELKKPAAGVAVRSRRHREGAGDRARLDESLLEVLHQSSISLGDPQAISEDLDAIVRESERIRARRARGGAMLRSGLDGGAGRAD